VFRNSRILWRLVQINYIFAKYGLGKIILSLHLFSPLRFLVYFNPRNWWPRPYGRGEAIRVALIELGPIFVKFGQALSTRADILPADVLAALAELQDKVPPFPAAHAKRILETEFSCPITDLFKSFTAEPLGSASIAQVHAATLPDGREAVVKLQRPGIAKQIEKDIEVLERLAECAERYLPHSKRLRPKEIVADFKRNLADELDFFYEASNGSQLRRNFQDSSTLYIPEIYWSYTRRHILVMERIYGIPITDIEALKAHGVNIKKLAERGVELFFTQVFRDSFFHADMHPGNLFVSLEHPEDPMVIAVDFGIVGSLEARDKRYLAENFHAFFQRDYYRVAELHVESGWVPYQTRLTEFEAAIRTVSEPIFERPLHEISCAQMIMRLLQVGRRFNMEILPQFVLLQKTLFAIEGLARRLYPQLDLWQTAKPFLEQWLRAQLGPSALFEKIKTLAPYWIERLPEVPQLLIDNLVFQREHRLASRQPVLPQVPRSFAPFYLGVSLTLIATAIANVVLNASGWFDQMHLQWINTGLLSLGVLGIVLARKQ
jgi:ubiquinone biosynthesis protein